MVHQVAHGSLEDGGVPLPAGKDANASCLFDVSSSNIRPINGFQQLRKTHRLTVATGPFNAALLGVPLRECALEAAALALAARLLLKSRQP